MSNKCDFAFRFNTRPINGPAFFFFFQDQELFSRKSKFKTNRQTIWFGYIFKSWFIQLTIHDLISRHCCRCVCWLVFIWNLEFIQSIPRYKSIQKLAFCCENGCMSGPAWNETGADCAVRTNWFPLVFLIIFFFVVFRRSYGSIIVTKKTKQIIRNW